MKYILIIVLFSSCWDGEINGIKYKLNKPCIKSHTETNLRTQMIGKSIYTLPYTETICDCYGKTDTIWQNKKYVYSIQ